MSENFDNSNAGGFNNDAPPQYPGVAEPHGNKPPNPNQQAYPSQPPVATQPIHTTTTIVSGPYGTVYRDIPVNVRCASCNTDIVTVVNHTFGVLTWLVCGIICLLGGWLLCLCLIPFCIPACKDVVHTCPNCHATIGKYDRLH
ncbi:LITAF domain-containing protein-like [Saccoglossus kowalevskii]|uniref:Lipopolysaccharide-induced tumor necrosis factor-alpha factor homolog n=1 Tax=Saccoglossus kowalevskii TaxID=10224 RepID=A0ABM0MQK9_SACKO|nr:PREDICTED: lipopolysaccharide-induced tumor necrosis factor-alpha factor homolog [Saccoglossus kowalevskii]